MKDLKVFRCSGCGNLVPVENAYVNDDGRRIDICCVCMGIPLLKNKKETLAQLMILRCPRCRKKKVWPVDFVKNSNRCLACEKRFYKPITKKKSQVDKSWRERNPEKVRIYAVTRKHRMARIMRHDAEFDGGKLKAERNLKRKRYEAHRRIVKKLEKEKMAEVRERKNARKRELRALKNSCMKCGDCCRENEHQHACVLTKMEASKIEAAEFDGFQWVIPYVEGKCPFLKENLCTAIRKPRSCRLYFCERVRNEK